MSYERNSYDPQDVYEQQQRLAKEDPYGQAGVYPPPQPAYGQAGAYPPSPQPPYGGPSPVRPGLKVGNPWANGALYMGVVSLILSLITLSSLTGFAGLITGTFAIYRGVRALNQSKRLPCNAGRGRAIVAITLGALAWVFVLVSFALRSTGS
jgi:hypothetical protein